MCSGLPLLLQFEPIIEEGNDMLVHHFLVYGCDDNITEAERNYDGRCFTIDMPGVDACLQPVCGWAVGGTVNIK